MPREAKLSIIGSGHANPRIFRFPPPEQNTTTQQHNTMKRRLATANRQPNFTSAATTRRSAITPTWRPRTHCMRSSMQKKPPPRLP